ncbi:MAG TPA: serine hydrolase [Acidimicrobiales bacterium]|nr:serine hydrolase [Acidimicrobiales bacterium]
MTGAADVGRAVRRAFGRARVAGWLHVIDIDHGAEVAVGADEPVALASVFKLPVLVALYRAADAGRVDLAEPIRLRRADRTSGVTGLAALRDDVELSLRDLAQLMITVSDNAAADAVVDRLGLDAVARTVADLGLHRTAVAHRCRDQHAALAHDLERLGITLPQALADPAAQAGLRVLEPATTNRSTPRELTSLLRAVWRDEAAAPRSCSAMRDVLRLQVWPHRLASGFPSDDVLVAGKTGTLPPLRSEVGVVELPGGRRYAVAVFTRSRRPTFSDPGADAVIGATARLAVDHLTGAGG